MNEKPEWTRILEQIGALTVLLLDTTTAPDVRHQLWRERQKLIDRIQADRDGKQTADGPRRAERRGAETEGMAAA